MPKQRSSKSDLDDILFDAIHGLRNEIGGLRDARRTPRRNPMGQPQLRRITSTAWVIEALVLAEPSNSISETELRLVWIRTGAHRSRTT
jgi:hypothetical protein